MKAVTAYVDGACEPNPGLGGWGVLLMHKGKERRLHGGERQTTNNRMEMTAALKALEALKERCAIMIYSDSMILIGGMTKSVKKRAKRAAQSKLPNADLWELLDAAAAGHIVTWQWVRGHAGNPGNEEADRLANLGRRELA